MRNLSSIFSFNTLTSIPRPAPSLWITLAVMATFRIILFFTGPSMVKATDGWIIKDFGNFYDIAENPGSGKKGVCFASGSSRLGLSLNQRTLSKLTGYYVEKAPLSASSPWEILKLLLLKDELLDNIDILIFDLQVYQFNDNCPTRFRRMKNFNTLSSWSERTALNSSFFIAEIARDLWPVHRERISFESIVTLKSTVASNKSKFRPMDSRWAAFRSDRKVRESYKADYFQPEIVVERHMKDFEYSEFMESAVHRLIDLFRARNIPVIVIVPPASVEFTRFLRENHPTGYKRFISFTKSLNEDGVHVFVAETPGDIGEKNKGFFMDYGHMTGKGAVNYTKWLAEQMKKSGVI